MSLRLSAVANFGAVFCTCSLYDFDVAVDNLLNVIRAIVALLHQRFISTVQRVPVNDLVEFIIEWVP